MSERVISVVTISRICPPRVDEVKPERKEVWESPYIPQETEAKTKLQDQIVDPETS